jgi:hypothetical protein
MLMTRPALHNVSLLSLSGVPSTKYIISLRTRRGTARQDSDSEFQFSLGPNLIFSYTEYGSMHSEQLKVDSIYKMVVRNQFSVYCSPSSFRNSRIIHIDLFGCYILTLLTEVHKLRVFKNGGPRRIFGFNRGEENIICPALYLKHNVSKLVCSSVFR